jgi:hypothetical protein
MKALCIVIALAGELTLSSTGAASAQIRVGGHGAASAPANGSYGSTLKGTAGRIETRTGRHGPSVGVGGSSHFSVGIGNSRVNSAISSQGRGRGGGRFR